LPPEERLRRAEELGRLARQAQTRGPRKVIIIFDSYEDFYEWRKSRLIGA
jgi:heme-degrading monooxygenase HmoA